MVIMHTTLENMNSFPKSEMLFSDNDDFTLPMLAKCKLRGQELCRTGLVRTNSETMTRKPDSSEIDFERRSSRCQVSEQESSKYRVTNLIHKVDLRRETIDHEDLVRRKEETTETKIYIVERRTSNITGRFVLAVWKQLKRIAGVKNKQHDALEAAIHNAEIEAKKIDSTNVISNEMTPIKDIREPMPIQKMKISLPNIILKRKQAASGDKASEPQDDAFLATNKNQNKQTEVKTDESNLQLPIPVQVPDLEVKKPTALQSRHSTKKLFILKLIPAKKKLHPTIPNSLKKQDQETFTN